MWTLLIGEFRRRWVEYALGALAISLVVAALVTTRAVSVSAEKAVHDLAHELGKNMWVLPAGTNLTDFHAWRFDGHTLAEDAVTRLRRSALAPHIGSIQARLFGEVEVRENVFTLVGEELRWPKIPGVIPAALGAEAARRTGLAVGDAFDAGDRRFTVVQVWETAPDGLDDAVFVPLASAQHLLGRPGALSALRLGGCWCKIDVVSLGKQVETLLPGTRAITVAGVLAAQQGSVTTVQRYSRIIALAGLALVAAIIAALMASQTRRRSRELGLLVAIGASPRWLVAMVIAQALVTGGAGAVAGGALAVPLSAHAGAALLGAPLPPVPGVMAPLVLAAMVVSALAAAVVARGAARTDPVVVMRES